MSADGYTLYYTLHANARCHPCFCHAIRSSAGLPAARLMSAMALPAYRADSPVPSAPTLRCRKSSRHVSEGCTRFGIHIHDGAGFNVVHENRILSCVKNRPMAFFRDAQRFIRFFAFGDISGDTADGIGDAVRVIQRKLDRDVGCRPSTSGTVSSNSLGHFAAAREIIRAKRLCDFRRQNLCVGFSYQLRMAQMENAPELPVGKQKPAFCVLRKIRRRLYC